MTKEYKKQMKSIIKPLIKECLKEVLVEEGLIKVMQEHIQQENKQVLARVPESKPIVRKLQQESVQKKQESINEIKKNLSGGGFDPFAGTKDIDQMEAEAESKKGVNINSLFGDEMVNSWNQQLDILNGKKA